MFQCALEENAVNNRRLSRSWRYKSFLTLCVEQAGKIQYETQGRPKPRCSCWKLAFHSAQARD